MNEYAGVVSVAVAIGASSEIVGEVVSIVNEATDKALLALPTESVTVTVQFVYVPSASALNEIVLGPDDAPVVPLVQLPPYEIVPASSVVNVYAGVVSFVGVATGVTPDITGAVVSKVTPVLVTGVATLLDESVPAKVNV